ncbi:hypothetical protein ACU8KI_16075 [Rhizobium leguminosarum]
MNSKSPHLRFRRRVLDSAKRSTTYIAAPLYVLTAIPLLIVVLRDFVSLSTVMIFALVLLLAIGAVLIFTMLLKVLPYLVNLIASLINLTNKS